MDILIHTLSGTTVATAMAGYFGKSKRERIALVGLGAFAGALPDFDAISLWSKFDATIGKWLNLTHTGKEIYFGKFWYSHHAFLHSIAGVLCIIACFFLLNRLFISSFPIKKIVLPAATFFLSFCSHLLGDMPTPASVWGGVALCFPAEQYVGGWGKIWWWNNYDIFLILLCCTSINFILLITIRQDWRKRLTVGLVGIAFLLISYQVNTRGVDFAYTGHTSKFQDYEKKSLTIQRNILGNSLFNVMVWFDQKLPVYF